FAILPVMMSDAHKNYRNCPGAGRPQRSAGAYARGRNHVAVHISRAAASQLPPVFLGSARLARRHLDATDCDELVRLPNHKFKTSARCGGGGWRCADHVFSYLGRRAGWYVSETLDRSCVSILPNCMCVFIRRRHMA